MRVIIIMVGMSESFMQFLLAKIPNQMAKFVLGRVPGQTLYITSLLAGLIMGRTGE